MHFPPPMAPWTSEALTAAWLVAAVPSKVAFAASLARTVCQSHPVEAWRSGQGACQLMAAPDFWSRPHPPWPRQASKTPLAWPLRRREPPHDVSSLQEQKSRMLYRLEPKWLRRPKKSEGEPHDSLMGLWALKGQSSRTKPLLY